MLTPQQPFPSLQRPSYRALQPLFENSDTTRGSFIEKLPIRQQIRCLRQGKSARKCHQHILKSLHIFLALSQVASKVHVSAAAA